jgi:hypothetical protein
MQTTPHDLQAWTQHFFRKFQRNWIDFSNSHLAFRRLKDFGEDGDAPKLAVDGVGRLSQVLVKALHVLAAAD